MDKAMVNFNIEMTHHIPLNSLTSTKQLQNERTYNNHMLENEPCSSNYCCKSSRMLLQDLPVFHKVLSNLFGILVLEL